MSQVLTPPERGLERRWSIADDSAAGGDGRPLLWELPFWGSLLVWSLYPSASTPWFEFAAVPVSSKELLALALTGCYLLLALSSAAVNRGSIGPTPGPPASPLRGPWHHYLPVLTTGIVGYAALSVAWSGLGGRDTAAMLYTLLSTASSVVLGYLLIANRSAAAVRSFLWRLTFYLAALGLLYSAESFLSLGLRSDLGRQFDPGDFGIQRVRGPLFTSSTGFFILLPAMAFAIQQILQPSARRLLNVALFFALIITIIGLGSRGGLILLGLYFLLLAFIRDKRKVVILPLVTVVALLAVVLVFSAAQTTRLQSFGDSGRSDTHSASWQIITNRAIATSVFGSGYGSYWPWYLPEVEFGAELYDLGLYTGLVWNPFGALLYHPHSTLLLLAVELGAIGLLYFLALWSVLLRTLWQSLRGGPCALFGIGVAVSGFSMFFDLFLFRTPQFNALWWIFVFGALALTKAERDEPHR